MNQKVNDWVQKYGDMIYDLCVSMVHYPSHGQLIFRSILKKTYFQSLFEKYSVFEQAWILKIACEKLLENSHELNVVHELNQIPEINLAYSKTTENKLKDFRVYFSRLRTEEQLILLLKDKWNLPLPDIAAALSIPEGSLEVKRRLALQTLAEWVLQEDALSPALEKVVQTIEGLHKHHLPPSLKEAPLSLKLPRPATFRMTLSQLERIPWYVRFFIESTGTILLILAAVSAAPKLRNFYELQMEEHLNGMQNDWEPISENTPENSNADQDQNEGQHPPHLKNNQGNLESSAEAAGNGSEQDEIVGEDETEHAVLTGKSSSRADLWRFTLKTVTPDELRTQVVKVLTDLKLPLKPQHSQGIQVPGGIEFDLMIPIESVDGLRQALEKLNSSLPTMQQQGAEALSWYRVKSKKPIPIGKAKVIIWLSQPTRE